MANYPPAAAIAATKMIILVLIFILLLIIGSTRKGGFHVPVFLCVVENVFVILVRAIVVRLGIPFKFFRRIVIWDGGYVCVHREVSMAYSVFIV